MFRFGNHWFIYVLLTVFTYYLAKNCAEIFSDGGVTEKCVAVEKALQAAQKEKLEGNSNANQRCVLRDNSYQMSFKVRILLILV